MLNPSQSKTPFPPPKPRRRHCYACGVELIKGVNKTADHVPPDGFFPQPKPENLITVPCCNLCNNDKSDDENFFRLLMALGIDRTNEMEELYNQKIIRTLENGSLRPKVAKLLEDSREVVRRRHGVFELAYHVKLDPSLLHRVGKNIGKGLTAYKYPLMRTHELLFHCQIVKTMIGFLTIMSELSGHWAEPIVKGKDCFHAYHTSAENTKNEVGVWIITLHQKFTFAVFYWAKQYKTFGRKIRAEGKERC